MGLVLLYAQTSIGGPTVKPTEWLGACNLGTDRLVSLTPPDHSTLLTLLSPLETDLWGLPC